MHKNYNMVPERPQFDPDVYGNAMNNRVPVFSTLGRGPKGNDGEKGEKGDPMTIEDMSAEQLQQLIDDIRAEITTRMANIKDVTVYTDGVNTTVFDLTDIFPDWAMEYLVFVNVEGLDLSYGTDYTIVGDQLTLTNPIVHDHTRVDFRFLYFEFINDTNSYAYIMSLIGSGPTPNYNITDALDNHEERIVYIEACLPDLDMNHVHVFDTVADMKLDNDLKAGMICHTSGFHVSGDGGAAWYKITNAGTANEMDVIACGELFANRISAGKATNISYGAIDNANQTNVLKLMFAKERDIEIVGNLTISEPIQVNSETNVICNANIEYDFSNMENNRQGVFYGENAENITWSGGTVSNEARSAYELNDFAVFHFLDCENVYISDVELDDISSVYAICMESSRNCIVSNCSVDRFTYGGIIFLNKCYDSTIEYCTVKQCLNHNSPNTYYISLSLGDIAGQTDAGCVRCKCVYCNVDGTNDIWWEGIDCHGGTDVEISHNVVHNFYCGIAVVNAAQTGFPNRVIISDNIIYNDANTAESKAITNAGISNSANNCIISNNYITGFGKYGSNAASCAGILVQSELNDSSNSIIVGNIINDCANYGVHIAQCGNIEVCENKICMTKSSSFTQKYGIITKNQIIEVIVKNNVIRNSNRPIGGSYNNPITYPKYVKFCNNDIDNPSGISNYDTITDMMLNIPSGMGVTIGHVGDIVYKSNPSVGNPIGWICITAATENDNAVWAPLANL